MLLLNNILLGSFGVVAGGALIYVTGLQRVDPFLAVVLLGVITCGCWGLLTPSRRRTNAVDTNLEGLHAFLLGQPGVLKVSKLRIWALNPADTALRGQLV